MLAIPRNLKKINKYFTTVNVVIYYIFGANFQILYKHYIQNYKEIIKIDLDGKQDIFPSLLGRFFLTIYRKSRQSKISPL